MRGKRIEIINTNQFVPKKAKIVQNKSQAPAETAGSTAEVKPSKSSSAQRPPVRKKNPSSQKAKATMPPEAGTTVEPSDEEIRMRAYFISERRRRFALPGDAESDWLEAKRQLLSETGPR